MAEMLSGAAGSLQGSIQGLAATGWAWVDKILPPERRASLMSSINKFAAERPGVASFLLSHLALSGLPIAIFIIFTITVAIVALLVAIIVALLAAVLFIVVMAGFALAILFPVLLFTTFVAVAVWIWGWGAYYLLKWFNQKEVPGIHTGFQEGMSKEAKNFLGDGGAKKVGGADGANDTKPKSEKQNGEKESAEARSSSANVANSNDSKKLAKRHPGHKLESPRDAAFNEDGPAAKDEKSSSAGKNAETAAGQNKSTPRKTSQNSVPKEL